MNSKVLTREELKKHVKSKDESVMYVEKKWQPNSSHLWDCIVLLNHESGIDFHDVEKTSIFFKLRSPFADIK